MRSLPRTLARALITVYQKTISPDHGPLRRFFPGGVCVHAETCSEYGKRVIAEEGVFRGSLMTLRRIVQCR